MRGIPELLNKYGVKPDMVTYNASRGVLEVSGGLKMIGEIGGMVRASTTLGATDFLVGLSGGAAVVGVTGAGIAGVAIGTGIYRITDAGGFNIGSKTYDFCNSACHGN